MRKSTREREREAWHVEGCRPLGEGVESTALDAQVHVGREGPSNARQSSEMVRMLQQLRSNRGGS